MNLGQLIVQWRVEAWQNAARILEARGLEDDSSSRTARPVRLDSIEQTM